MQDKQSEFLKALVERGLGIYGRDKMAQICHESQVALMDDNSLDWLTDDHEKALQNLLINYSRINLPARMTVMVLAKKHDIPVPEELGKGKKRSRFLGRLRNRFS